MSRGISEIILRRIFERTIGVLSKAIIAGIYCIIICKIYGGISCGIPKVIEAEILKLSLLLFPSVIVSLKKLFITDFLKESLEKISEYLPEGIFLMYEKAKLFHNVHKADFLTPLFSVCEVDHFWH